MKTVYVVDDSMVNLSLADISLKTHYRVLTLPSAQRMFDLLSKIPADLILLDIFMPVMDGFEAMRQLKANPAYADIPVIFLTGSDEAAEETRAFELGAADLVMKPFNAHSLLNRVNAALSAEEKINKRIARIEAFHGGVLSVLADTCEQRDRPDGHTRRIESCIKILVESLKERKLYQSEVRLWDANYIAAASRLHDIGMFAVPESIINKPGALSPEEYDVIKNHPAQGCDLINMMITPGSDASFFFWAKRFTLAHHERWDGSGYPKGLTGLAIPLEGRLLAVCDAYDALTSPRPYRKPVEHFGAVSLIMKDRDKLFDPVIADLFLEINELLPGIIK